MKILIIGSNGQLGRELTKRCTNRNIVAVSFDLPEFNITDNENVWEKIQVEKPGLVINASAYTAVDKAEDDVETAYKVNHTGPGYLASACNDLRIPLIHVSTDYVFDGKTNKPYSEDNPVSPIGVYGKSKEAGEVEVKNRLANHIVIRTAWLYSIHGNNFVKTMIKLANDHKSISVVDDQYGCPTLAGDLADAILEIAEQIENNDNISWGTYHYCGKGIITWYEFARQIFELAGKYKSLKVKDIIPITTAEYPTPTERPVYSALDCSLIENTFNITQRPWRESLDEMINEYFINGSPE